MGRLGTTVAGTDPSSTGGHPKLQQKERRRLQMNKFRFTIKILAIAIFALAFASMAQAQATRTWVSGVGDDANPCSRTAPCKTFAGAISKTAAGGEIDALDPAGYGAVTITKSITIDACCMASILATGTNAINVNGANIIVNIRNLSLQQGLIGVNFVNGLMVTLESVVINGFTTAGVSVPSSTQSNILNMKDVIIRNCGIGVNVANTASFTTALAFDNVNIRRSGTNGITAGNGTAGSITRSYIGVNGAAGIAATAGTVAFSVTDTTIADNSTGISTSASAHVRIARCLITGNSNAFGLGGAIDTGGNNTIMGNTINQDPNGTLFIQK